MWYNALMKKCKLPVAMLLAVVIALLASSPTSAKPFPPEQNCDTGMVVRHDAFYSQVFWNFPERAVPGVHGYFATESCSMMGRIGTLYLGDYEFKVSVADCLNSSHATEHFELWGTSYLGDVDRKLWIEAQVPNAPTEAGICWE